MTHDLFNSALGQLDARIDSVTIVDFKDSTFFGQINLDTPAGPVSLDARPSDCVALALRGGAPVYVQPEVLDRAGIVPAEETDAGDGDGDEEEEDDDDDGGTVH